MQTNSENQSYEELFREHLMPGEEIKWCGISQLPKLPASWVYLPLGIVLFAAGVGALTFIYSYLRQDWLNVLSCSTMVLISLAIFMLGLGLIVASLCGKSEEESVYAVTNKRIINIDSLSNKPAIYHLDNVTIRVHSEDADKTGIVEIQTNGAGFIDKVFIHNVVNPKSLCELINRLKDDVVFDKAPEAESAGDASSPGYDLFGKDLLPGEVIEWYGQPIRPLLLGKYRRTVILKGLLYLVLGSGALWFGINRLINGSFAIFLLSLAVTFALLLYGGAMLCFVIITTRQADLHRYYAVTNKRIIYLNTYAVRMLDFVYLSSISEIRTRFDPRGFGSLFFMPKTDTIDPFKEGKIFALLNIPDPEAVKDVIEQLREEIPVC